MDKINFSYNWNNKLAGVAFTTLRLKNPKYQVGTSYEICLKKGKSGFATLFVARIIDIKDIRLSGITEYIALLDTGYRASECKAIVRNIYSKSHLNWDTQLLSFILLRKESKTSLPSRPAQVNLLSQTE